MATEIKECHGGMISFGLWGQAGSTYMTRYIPCNSAFQDQKYGPHMRLHNLQQGKNLGHSRCTVCGNGHGIVRP